MSIKKFDEFLNEGVVNEELRLDDSIEIWGDEIVKALHYNNDEMVHGLFDGIGDKLRDSEPEEAKAEYKKLAEYIRSKGNTRSFFPESTEKHFYDMYLKKYFN